MFKKKIFAFVLIVGIVSLVIMNTSEADLKKDVATDDKIETEGTMESLEGKMTSWMYGTHIITSKGKTKYALNSNELGLNSFNGMEVKLRGTMIHSGVDTGPTYLNVTEVEVLNKIDDNGNGTPAKNYMDYQEIAVIGGIIVVLLIVVFLFIR